MTAATVLGRDRGDVRAVGPASEVDRPSIILQIVSIQNSYIARFGQLGSNVAAIANMLDEPWARLIFEQVVPHYLCGAFVALLLGVVL